MKLVTREHAKVDPVARPRLIRRFVDPANGLRRIPQDELEVLRLQLPADDTHYSYSPTGVGPRAERGPR